MKPSTVNVLDQNDESVIDMLVSVKVPRTAATMLVFLQHVGSSTSRDIEVGAGLRQPEVSKALRYLNTKEWIKTTTAKPTGGRPCSVYTLAKSFPDIIAQIQDEHISYMKDVTQAVAKSREILA